MPNLNGHAESIKDSQFKAAWQSGPTRTIRVPIALADATLEYARQLDRGVEPRDTSTKTAVDVDASILEPRDTKQISRTDFISIEPRDTALTEKTLPDAATILSKLRGKRKKSTATLADIEAILEMIEG